jgi:hypothetical protein
MELAIKNNKSFIDYFKPKFTKKDLQDQFNKSLIDLKKIELNNTDNKKNVLLGMLMNRIRGKVDSKDVIGFVENVK